MSAKTSFKLGLGEHNDRVFIRINTHVDDACVVYNDEDTYRAFRKKLEARLASMSQSDKQVLSESDDDNVYLGISVDYIPGGIKIHQNRYALDILAMFNMLEAKPAPTPYLDVKLSKEHNAVSEKDKQFMEGKNYRRLVGMLLFLARCTRPDIMAAVTTMARFQNDTGPTHWKYGMHVLRYLAGTLTTGIQYGPCNLKKESHVQYVPLTMYHDSDWGSDTIDRRSTTGWVSLSWGGPINWCSTRQKCIAQSSCEAEYIASNEAAKESVWALRLFEDLGYPKDELHFAQHSTDIGPDEYEPAHHLRKFPNEQEQQGCKPLTMFCDSTAAISNTVNSGRFHSRMKHVEVRYHYVRDMVQRGILKVAKVHTDLNVSDILTKAVSKATFIKHRDTLVSS
jgi:hypothetical protein